MIESERLILQPLKHHQLLKYIRDDHSLEKELKLKPTIKNISRQLQKDLKESVLPNIHDEDKNYLYDTLWIIISKQEHAIVGDISFVGKPDQDGEIQIGYGTYEAYRGKGFMTEAVKIIIEWAKVQPSVKSIFATTTKVNVASYSILEKNNFVPIGEVDGMLSWQILLK